MPSFGGLCFGEAVRLKLALGASTRLHHSFGTLRRGEEKARCQKVALVSSTCASCATLVSPSPGGYKAALLWLPVIINPAKLLQHLAQIDADEARSAKRCLWFPDNMQLSYRHFARLQVDVENVNRSAFRFGLVGHNQAPGERRSADRRSAARNWQAKTTTNPNGSLSKRARRRATTFAHDAELGRDPPRAPTPPADAPKRATVAQWASGKNVGFLVV